MTPANRPTDPCCARAKHETREIHAVLGCTQDRGRSLRRRVNRVELANDRVELEQSVAFESFRARLVRSDADTDTDELFTVRRYA